MGSTISYIKYKIGQLEERLSIIERDYMNLYDTVQKNIHMISRNSRRTDDNYKHILNISLLEEGRSVYRPRSRVAHTASSYK